MTPRSWEHWVAHYEEQGYQVLTPAYPGFEIEVEALRENPDVIAEPTVPETVDHLAGVIEGSTSRRSSWATPSAARSPSCCSTAASARSGVVIDSAPTEGVRVNPPSQIKSLFPVLKNPANRHRAAGFTPEQFHYAFTNTLSARGVRRGLRPLPHPGAGQLGLGLRPDRELQAGPPGDLGRLRQRRPRAAAVHRRRRGPHHAAVGEQVERQALQEVGGAHRVPRLPRPLALDVRRAGLGSGRRQRPRVGRSSTQCRGSARRPERAGPRRRAGRRSSRPARTPPRCPPRSGRPWPRARRTPAASRARP